MRRVIVGWFFLVWALTAFSAPSLVIYPRHQAEKDPQLDYVMAVLAMALEKSGHPYQLKQSDAPMVQSRAMSEIANRSGAVDIVWEMTNAEREQILLPIRIPIDFGLIGWRLALVRADRLNQFEHVSKLSDMEPFIAGQMHDWPDTAILRANKLKVETTTEYEGLFKQLWLGRIDYFPRSVIEIRNELAAHANLGLAIDPHLLIRYPAAFYFFVGKHRPDLAHDIESGLQRALVDGSFDKLFHEHFGNLVKELQLDKRQLIQLQNPFLPAATPLDDKRLWIGAELPGLSTEH